MISRRDERGGVLLIALIITIFVTMLALAAIHETGLRFSSTHNESDAAHSLIIAQAGIENASHLPLETPNWRTTLGGGTWLDEKKIGRGVFTVTADDPFDGMVEVNGARNSSSADTVRFTSTGGLGSARRALAASYVPLPHDALRHVVFSRTRVGLDGVTLEGRLRANGNVTGVGGAEIHGDITTLAGSSVTGSLDDADTDVVFVADPAGFPEVDFGWFVAAGERIYLPFGNRIHGETITRETNPYGLASPDGIYWIDAGGSQVDLSETVVIACLAILNASQVCIRIPFGSTTHYSHSSPDPERLPALVVDGDLVMQIEEGGAMWAVLGGDWHKYESGISGAIYCTGRLSGPQIDASKPITIEGAIIAHEIALSGPGTLIRHDPSLNRNPLVELCGEGLRIRAGLDAGNVMRRIGDIRGLTLLETLAAAVILGLLAAAIGSVAHVILSTDREADATTQVSELGLALLREIAALPFEDPQSPGGFGPEAGEWSPPENRSLFDDVDDYSVWNGPRPLQTKGGALLANPDYTRRVTIDYADSEVFFDTALAPNDYKRITVDVYERADLVASFVTVRVRGARYVDLDE